MPNLQQMLMGGAGGAKTYVDEVFSTYLYTGDPTNGVAVVNGLDNAGEGGLVWLKSRTDSWTHHLFDTARDKTNWLRTDDSSAEAGATYDTNTDSFQSFNSNGFTIAADNSAFNYNTSTDYSSFNWRKAKGFFDIVTWTGNGTTRNISHGLGSVPGLIIVKSTDEAEDWVVYHKSTGNQGYGYLNQNAAFSTGSTIWDSTTPTSTTFRVNGNNDYVNKNNANYIAYVFAGGESTDAKARSVSFDSSSEYLEIADDADFDWGSTFTFEAWVKPEFTGQNVNTVYSQGAFSIDVFDNGRFSVDANHNFFGGDFWSEQGMVTEGDWTHIAVVCSGGVPKLYVNGINSQNAERTGVNVTGKSENVKIAKGTYFFKGEISNLRIVKGTAVYTSGFVPPTKPLTNITNTVLLCCNNSSVTGADVTPNTISANNSPTASINSPFDDIAGFKFGEGGDQNVIKCGSYTGNGNGSAGPEINLGWEPQWLLIRRTASEGWIVIDSMRGIFDNQYGPFFEANYAGGENANKHPASLTATGFKIRTNDQTVNSDGSEYIYMCIRRPDGYVGKPVEAGTEIFATDIGAGGTTIPNYDSNFPVDLAIDKRPALNDSPWYASGRLTGRDYVNTASYDAHSDHSTYTWDSNVGWGNGSWQASDYRSWMFKRAALFFDQVVWTGTGNLKQVRHNLGQKPELIIVKNIDSSGKDWRVYHKDLNGGTNPEQYNLKLNDDDAEAANSSIWNDTAPTALDFTVKDYSDTNGSGDRIWAWLFGSVAGISKVGTYNAPSPVANRVITTGFQPRFVLIKNIDYAEDWVMFDHDRGWDNRIRPNRRTSTSTGTYLSVQSTGFTVTNQSSTALNGDSGHNFIYLAVA